jgi:hypothetical protein
VAIVKAYRLGTRGQQQVNRRLLASQKGLLEGAGRRQKTRTVKGSEPVQSPGLVVFVARQQLPSIVHSHNPSRRQYACSQRAQSLRAFWLLLLLLFVVVRQRSGQKTKQ